MLMISLKRAWIGTHNVKRRVAPLVTAAGPRGHCTAAFTDALPLTVKVQVRALAPPLEHAPDHTTSRPFGLLSVIAVPAANDADPVLPTVTLMPAGLEVICSPLRPVAVTVTVLVVAGGVTVIVADFVRPPTWAVIVMVVDVVTALVPIAKVTLVAPAGTVALAGTVAAAPLLVSATASPPAGAADVSDSVPCPAAPPVTLAGVTDTVDNDAAAGGGVTVNVAGRVAPP